MDRRKALKKLGTAGVLVVGGSSVLSSRAVALASSGACVTTIPDTVPLRFTQPTGSPRVVRVRWQNSRPAGATSQTYMWRNAQILLPTSGGAQIVRANVREVSLRRLRPGLPNRQQVWQVGDLFSVQVEVTWACAGGGPDIVTYEISETARTLGSQWIANAARVS